MDLDHWDWLRSVSEASFRWETGFNQSCKLCSSKDAQNVLLLCAEKAADDWMTFFLASGAYEKEEFPDQKSALWLSKPCKIPKNAEGESLKLCKNLMSQLINEMVRKGVRFLGDLGTGSADDESCEVDESAEEACAEAFEAVLICRAFWACACETSVEKGSMFLEALGRRLERLPGVAIPRLLMCVGGEGDAEVALIRAIGYMATKWLCLGTLIPVALIPKNHVSVPDGACAFVHSYAEAASVQLWKMRAFAPLLACRRLFGGVAETLPKTDDMMAQYLLSHQQLEATVQLLRSVRVSGDGIEVHFSLDNIRCHVAGLMTRRPEPGRTHRHVPTRITVHVYPASTSASSDGVRASDVAAVSLNKSSSSCFSLASGWRFRQRCEGGRAAFQWTLYDSAGHEVWCHRESGSAGGSRRKNCEDGTEVVLSQEDYWQSIVWRLHKSLEGKCIKWTVRVSIIVSYVPPGDNVDKDDKQAIGFWESRCVDFVHDIHTQLVNTSRCTSNAASTISCRYL